MDKSLTRLFLAIVLSILCGILCALTSYYVRKHYLQTEPQIIEVVRCDTMRIYTPVCVHDTLFKYVYAKLPTTQQDAKEEHTEEIEKTQTNPMEAKKPNGFSSFSDSAWVVVPITQKEYADTNYRAWVRGYLPSLDSIKIYNRTIERTLERKRPRLNLTLGVGASFNGKVTPAVFFGVGYSFCEIKL